MYKKAVLVISALTFAFGILFISIFRTASVKYSFNPAENRLTLPGESRPKVDYKLPFPGKVLPDSLLWPLKATRDKLWLIVNTNPNREAELKLLFADKRIGSALLLFQGGKADTGITTLTKAEKYLEQALINEQKNLAAGRETRDLMYNISLASLKHYEIMTQILSLAPEDAKPQIINVSVYPRKVYEESRNSLLERRYKYPENPFNWP